MNADYGLIGKQISFYRHQVGLTQEQLAEACNLSVSYRLKEYFRQCYHNQDSGMKSEKSMCQKAS